MTTTTAPAPTHVRRPGALTRPDGSPVRALVVDDEQALAELLCTALRYEGWRAELAPSALDAVERAAVFDPDVVLADAALAEHTDLLPRLRRARPAVSVLLLAGRDAPDAQAASLTADDDYVTKPFGVEEVVARLRGLLRRAGAVTQTSDSTLVVGDLRLDEDSHEVWRGDDAIRLTATEFELLRYFMRNPRRALSKAQILDRVWQYDFGGQANIVELYVSYLRRKIDKGRAPMLHTLRGVGYVLRPAV
ncbi:two component transcriptional regulator, winged helix family [Cellulomonas flavigena DSM 20109]|uniref:Two component transcriptional regulator, winged helix family n=1 Tax=Cellulomonas flavigena (strain ATCC 482 / DSM 20109 / BCRC 11376 / JCM 18109 / NBRC 3775 / NCIMB 8073 / NRS 134) TaxID=446466 RepID=D5UII2_CELFN|nr:response regulator transcription factor [Cellulomonas flavigena]ADG73481.1 two component transcriptional regulator, winged helix family [Cellulomonas flavigena DSM 20109]